MKEGFLMKRNMKNGLSIKRNMTLVAALLLLTVLSLSGQPTTLALQAPTPLWHRFYGGIDSDRFYSMIEVSSGGFALLGYADSSFDGQDAWLVRTDADGVMLWNRAFDYNSSWPDITWEEGQAVIEVSTGGFAILSITGNTTNMIDAWFIRIDATGNHLWNRTYGTTNWERVESLIEVSSGGFAFAGLTLGYGNVDGADFWLTRLDTNGNIMWNKTYDTPGQDYAYELVEVSTGGFAIAGAAHVLPPNIPDAWLLRVDASGNHLWNTTFNAGAVDTEDMFRAFTEVSTGGFALGGYTNASGSDDIWLIRTDASGNHLWNRTWGGSNGYDYCRDIIEYGGGFALSCYSNCTTTTSRSDILLIRTDANGVQLWNTTWGGAHTDRGYSLIEASSGGLVIAGYTRSYSSGDSDALLLRFSSEAPPSPWEMFPWLPVVIIIVIAVVVLILVVWYLRRRK